MNNNELKAYVESTEPGYKAYLQNLKMLPLLEQARAIEKLRAGRRKRPNGYAARLLNWLESEGHIPKEAQNANRRRH